MSCNESDFYSPLLGWSLIVPGSVYLLLYIPCIVAIATSDLIKLPCYKIMFSMGYIDVLNLISASYICGFTALLGVRYCGNWMLFRLAGALTSGVWANYCALSCLLAVNRCAELHSEAFAEYYFGGRRGRVCIAATHVYGAAFGCAYLTPYVGMVFDSSIGLWIYDPRIDDTASYWLDLMNNLTAAAVITTLYVVAFVLLRRRSSAASERPPMTSAEKRLVLQATLICLMADLTCVLYVQATYFISSINAYYAIQFIWQATHGTNGLIYWALNKSIRTKMFGWFGWNNQVHSISAGTAVNVHQ